MALKKTLLYLVALGLTCVPICAQGITVAAAADLNYAMKDLAAGFQQKTGNKVALSFGSSGNIYSQILSGAPYDVFFSADAEYPKKLADAGKIDKASVRTYALGHLVLWIEGAAENADRNNIRVYWEQRRLPVEFMSGIDTATIRQVNVRVPAFVGTGPRRLEVRHGDARAEVNVDVQ